MKFLCDEMLGTLAKWLRIYGFDTFYANNEMNDDELIETAKKERLDLIGEGATEYTAEELEKAVELLEYWEDDRVVTIANRAVIIREAKNPFYHGKKPFVHIINNVVPHEFYGLGEVEPLERLQHELNAKRNQRLDAVNLKWRSHATTCVVLASKGYPGSYEKGKPIEGLDNLTRMRNVFAFCAGVKRENGRFLTNGGRVVGVTGMGKNLKESIKTVYRAIKKISFEGIHYRRDIGYKGLVS